MKKAVSLILINDEGLICGVSRKDNHELFSLIGGKVDSGDADIYSAIIRETKEETGLDIYDIELIHDEEYDKTGYHEHTFKAKHRGEINYDMEKEPAVVKWVEPEVVMNGAFGEYNEKVLSLVGIVRKEKVA